MKIITLLVIFLTLNDKAFSQEKTTAERIRSINVQRERTYSFFSFLEGEAISGALQLIDNSFKDQKSFSDTLRKYSIRIKSYHDSAKLVVENSDIKDGNIRFQCKYETPNQTLFLCYLTYKEGKEDSLICQITIASEIELKHFNLMMNENRRSRTPPRPAKNR